MTGGGSRKTRGEVLRGRRRKSAVIVADLHVDIAYAFAQAREDARPLRKRLAAIGLHAVVTLHRGRAHEPHVGEIELVALLGEDPLRELERRVRALGGGERESLAARHLEERVVEP